jgi:YgiT-type zinc finger domain-containing protein
MKCVLCRHGVTAPGTVTVTLDRGRTTVIFREVPAEICSNCGEEYVSNLVTAHLLEVAEAAIASGAEVEIRRYAA